MEPRTCISNKLPVDAAAAASGTDCAFRIIGLDVPLASWHHPSPIRDHPFDRLLRLHRTSLPKTHQIQAPWSDIPDPRRPRPTWAFRSYAHLFLFRHTASCRDPANLLFPHALGPNSGHSRGYLHLLSDCNGWGLSFPTGSSASGLCAPRLCVPGPRDR